MEEILCVGDAEAGERLDKFISLRLPQVSRALAQRLIDDGKVHTSDRLRKPNYRLKFGEIVRIDFPPPRESAALPEDIPLRIIYEDADLLVVDKPAGMVVHPAAGHSSGTLVNAVLGHSPDLVIGNVERPGIVHRLDRNTSGLILIAKNDAALRNLQLQFASRTVNKVYLALVDGRLETPQGKIDAPLGRDPHDRKRFAVAPPGRVRSAVTVFHVEARLGHYTLLRLEPKTGRTHQIRIHLAFIGHPVAGDKEYGRKRGNDLGLVRQFLHAWKLGFVHPTKGDAMGFTAALPPDLVEALINAGGNPDPWM